MSARPCPRRRAALRRAVGFAALLGVGACGPAHDDAALAEAAPERLRELGREEPGLYQVRAAAFDGARLVVLTSPEPAVHLFTPSGRKSWGGKGGGPAELQNPGDVAWVDGRVLVRDFRLGKVVSYDTLGGLVSTRRYGTLQVSRLESSARDTLLGLFTLAGAGSVVRVAGPRVDTVVKLPPPGEEIVLQAPGSPSLTMPPPFHPAPAWASLPGGRVAYWDGSSESLALLDLRGKEVERLELPGRRYPVTAEDRQAWLLSAVPSGDFAGRGDVFRPLREAAKDQVTFPDELPLVLGMRGDPRGGVWVRRAPSSSGEVWTYVDARGPRATLRFPPRRELLAVGAAELAVRARDELDVETVEIYRNPAVPE